MENELTPDERKAIIEEAAQDEIARIAGVPEPEEQSDAQSARKGEPKDEAPVADQDQEVQEPSLAEQIAELREQNKQLRKHVDTTYGRHGQEVQFIKRRLERQPASEAPNLNEVFNRLNIEDPAFAELKEEFPELAGQFVTALNKALTRDQAATQQPAKELEPPLAEEETQQRATQQPESDNPALSTMALDSLKEKHPDFLELAHFSSDQIAPGMVSVKWANQRFGEWLDTMPSDVKEAILIGGSIEQPSAAQILRIRDIMTEFKQHEAKTRAPTEEENKQESKPKPKVELSRTLMPLSRQSNKAAMTTEEIVEAAKQAELIRIARGY